jgi:hypothetical protein
MIHVFRPCYQRPEMLYFSLEYEAIARERAKGIDIKTVFAIDGGASPETIKLIDEFPYNKQIIRRPDNWGMTQNTLEGWRSMLPEVDTYIATLEDDVLIHKDYFLFTESQLTLMKDPKTACLSTGDMYRLKEEPNLGIVERIPQIYCGWGVCVTKQFLEHFLSLPIRLTGNRCHIQLPNGQVTGVDGLIQIVLRSEGWKSYMAYINRYLNIGVYGFDFRGGLDLPPTATFEDKVDWFKRHLTIGDWWKYSQTMRENLQSPTIPECIGRFNPLLEAVLLAIHWLLAANEYGR